ncbi:polysaccharide biosynthesis tyrosine autokinase [Pseudomaricurvus alcaniphilus]|uniref:GumC family protein n=1 Tax=Pseudomaricurvus alcaniphilus TaxID=1166482 RepID=UPI00140E2930|nr:polysaccharide biosynthesis tyrosine autokinase [Pseudomaricurvus alcaniphilus]NHN39593.1 polysaccharide biosynthesis tyrosine autokinase [Pseudomaricurvus alcaniphilus]
MNDFREFPLRQTHIQEDWNREEVIDLRQYWNTINRKKWPIMGLAAVVSVIAMLVVSAMTPIYQATSTILIESQNANVVSIEEVYGLDTRAQQYYETQFEILKSRPLAERVVDSLALTNHPTFKPEEKSGFNWRSLLPFSLSASTPSGDTTAPDPAIAATGEYLANLSIQPVRKTQLVYVNYQSSDPRLAANIANAHATAYIESMMDARVDMTQTAASWMTRRVEDLKQALAKSEANLQEFRERERIVDVDGLQSLPAKEIDELSTRLIQVRSELSRAKTAYLQVRQLQNASAAELSSVPAVMSDPLVKSFRQAIASAESKVAELSRRYGPKHPKMLAAQTELLAANENLARQTRSVMESIKTHYEDALNLEEEISAALTAAKGNYHDIGRKESQFRALQQEVESNRALYDMFYNRIRETAQTDDLKSANARIISPAITPTNPIKPKKKLIVVLAFMVSLMGGVAAAFLLEALDNTIKSVQDVEEKIKQPLLGMVPLVKMKGKESSAGHLFFDSKQHGFSEAIRTVRTGISLTSLDTPYKTILVTSSVSGEGKSTTAVNLAYAFGQMEKVLLIDADMRRPSIGKEFSIARNHAGLSELVTGNATLEEAIVHLEDEQIDVLVAGLIPHNPLELLSSRKLNSTLKSLRAEYDRIIIDCPPVLPVSDARVLSTLADAVVYVVKADATSRNQIKVGLDHLNTINAPITGVVLNQLDIRKAEKYSDYGYGKYYESYESQPA